MERYAAFMDDFCRLTVERFDGSLKAEHATGRNIAPFLELEWGPTATDLMWRIKRLLDPDGILAPRVVLDQDPRAHLRGLKTIPVIEAVADPCIECGFCEPTCPSRDLTTTPRQRIVLRREMMRQPAGSPVLRETAGRLRLRRRGHLRGRLDLQARLPGRHRHRRDDEGLPARPALAARGARRRLAATHFATVGARPPALAVATADAVRDRVGDRLAGGGHRRRPPGGTAGTGARMAAARSPAPRPRPAPHRAGGRGRRLLPGLRQPDLRRPRGPRGLSLPSPWSPSRRGRACRCGSREDVTGTCCATIWHSKGYDAGNAVMANRIVEARLGLDRRRAAAARGGRLLLHAGHRRGGRARTSPRPTASCTAS